MATSDLFSSDTVSVSWVMKRWNVSRTTVIDMLEAGKLRGYRITEGGWWRILSSSVKELEGKIRASSGL